MDEETVTQELTPELKDDLKANLDVLLKKINRNDLLKKLSDKNGIDIKNGVDLNDQSKQNIAVSILSLLIAKKLNDPEYNSLVEMGLNKRSKKVTLINKYKNIALDLMNQYHQ